MHTEALYVLQVGRQLGWVGVDNHIDQHWQKIISTCRTKKECCGRVMTTWTLKHTVLGDADQVLFALSTTASSTREAC